MNIANVFDDIIIAIDKVPADNGETARQRERKAVNDMLKELAGDKKLTHNEAGKPQLEGFNISISHTVTKSGGFAAIMLSSEHNVGIDIEYKINRVMKIASRFLRGDEHPVTVDEHLVYWCAKEAVYKLYSDDDLTYQQMRVNAAMTEVDNLKRGVVSKVSSVITDEFVLVYTFI